MKYMFLAYGDEQKLAAMATTERDLFEGACLSNDEALRQSGHLLGVAGLQGDRSAATVSVEHGSVLVADGPVAAAGLQLIGIFTISARDLNEAIQLAATMPQARGGPIEIWPILDLDGR